MTSLNPKHFVERWSNPDLRPSLTGSIIDESGCKCAQGDVLSQCGYTDDELRAMGQDEADAETARLLGISQNHAILLRNVNDSEDGCPQDVLDTSSGGIERLLGPNAKLVLAFWRYLGTMTKEQFDSVQRKARSMVRNASENKAWFAALTAAWNTAVTMSRDTEWYKAMNALKIDGPVTVKLMVEYASLELIVLDGIKSFYFLPILGLDDPRNQLAEFMVD